MTGFLDSKTSLQGIWEAKQQLINSTSQTTATYVRALVLKERWSWGTAVCKELLGFAGTWMFTWKVK